MSSRLNTTVILVVTFFLSVTLAFTQEDEFMKNVRKNIQKSEKEKALRTSDENKLGGTLYYLHAVKELYS